MAMVWAPTGYPPRKPTARMDSVPLGILHVEAIGFKKRSGCPVKAAVMIIDNRIKGNREGIRVVIQRFIPSAALSSAVFPSKISTSIPAADAKVI